jgi:hypothetical protein
MESLASGMLKEVLCSACSKETMPKSSTRQGSLHTLAQRLMAQLPSLQEPCTVKVASDKDYPSKFG